MEELTERIHLRLTPEEKQDLQSQAAEAGYPISVYVRAILFVLYPELQNWAAIRQKRSPQ
jgi:hypothetical protein